MGRLAGFNECQLENFSSVVHRGSTDLENFTTPSEVLRPAALAAAPIRELLGNAEPRPHPKYTESELAF